MATDSPEKTEGREEQPGFEMIYGLNELPPMGRTVVYGVQWVIIYLPVLMIFSALGSQVLGLGPEARAEYFQVLLLLAGVTAVLQTLLGHKLPIMDGPALAVFVTLAAMAPLGLAVMNGGMIIGGFLLLVIGLFGLMRFLGRLITDRVMGVFLLLLGFTILPFLLPMFIGVDKAHPNGQPLILLLSLGLTVLMSIIYHYLKGVLRSMSIFIGVVLGTLFFTALGLADFSAVLSAPWLTGPSLPISTWPKFDLPAMFSFTLAYLALLVNSAGALYSIEPLVKPKNMSQRFNRGLIFSGLSNMAAGVLGSIGTVPYASSPGIIAVTRVGSRFTLTACGLFLVVMAFLGKIT
ncbi:MAG: solute carrier family 23 protein, partial [Pseudomonadota bacterium]